jgi:hypoxanthine phosphoribosyltransferase
MTAEKPKEFCCLFPTWEELHSYAKDVSNKIKKSGFHPDIIIGLSRGGLVPARLLSDFLHIKKCYTIKVDHWGLTATKDGQAKVSQSLNVDLTGKNVLIVDDITDTGQSMMLSRDHIAGLKPKEIRTATLIHLKTSKFMPDFYGREMDWFWIIFPWNRREDLVNLTQKIENLSEKGAAAIKEELKQRFEVDITEEEVCEVLEHMEYLKNRKII